MSFEPLHDPLITAAPPAIAPGPLRQALQEHWRLAGSLHPHASERDRNYRLDPLAGPPVLVKLAHPDEGAAVTDLQIAALLHLERAAPDLPVPRIVPTREGATSIAHQAADGRRCVLRVLTYLPGEPLTEADPRRARDLGILAARLDRGFAGFTHSADRRRLIWDIREAPGLRALLPEVDDPALRALAEAALDRFEREAAPLLATLPGQVIHNDMNPHNVLADPADPARLTGIIDFGDILRASCLQEVATACAYLLRGEDAPLAAPRAFIAGYRTIRDLPEQELALLPTMVATRTALSVLVSTWRARRQPENAVYILRNQARARAGLEILARLPRAFLHADGG